MFVVKEHDTSVEVNLIMVYSSRDGVKGIDYQIVECILVCGVTIIYKASVGLVEWI